MTTHTSGEKVKVIATWADPLTALPDEPCHEGRLVASPIVRELLAAFGVKTCPDCHRYVGIAGRSRSRERP